MTTDEARADLAHDIAGTIIAEPDGMGLTWDQAKEIGAVLARHMQPVALSADRVCWMNPRPV